MFELFTGLTDIVIFQLPDKNSPLYGPPTKQFPLLLFGIDAVGEDNHDALVFRSSALAVISPKRGGLFVPTFHPIDEESTNDGV